MKNVFLKEIYKNPDDFLSMLALADWMEEQGEDTIESQFWRFLGTKQLCPDILYRSLAHIGGATYRWFMQSSFMRPNSGLLPRVLFRLIVDDDGDKGSEGNSFMWFENVQSMFSKTLKAWKKLSQEEREECLK